MRLAHISDVHFYAFPGIRASLGKRALGLANLYVGGRRGHFGGDTIPQLVEDVLAQRPDAVAITGDLTAMAHAEEFEMAREAFRPLFDALPVCIVPGNHDAYTLAAVRDRTMERVLGPWMAGGRWDPAERRWTASEPDVPLRWPVVFEVGDVRLVGVNPCRASLSATGRFPRGELDRLEGMLAALSREGRFVFLLCHYPLLDRDGRPYTRRGHNLLDLDELLAVLRRQPVGAVLHGHEHHWFTVSLPTPRRPVPIFNCGSSGYARRDPERTAGFFVFDVEGGELVSARRRSLLETGFREYPEGDARPHPPN